MLLAIACGCRPSSPAAPPEEPASPPQRIIAFAPSSVEIIAALGATGRLVAVGSFCHYPSEVTALPKVGGLFDPDLEAVLRLRPDLVVMRGENKELRRLCADVCIPIYEDSTEDLSDIFRTIDELGQLLGRRERAEQLTHEVRSELNRIARAVLGRPRPRVLFVVGRRSPDSLAGIITASNGTFVQEMIEYAGGENVFANLAIAYPEVSLEGILAARPEVVFDAMPESEPSDALDARIKAQWRQLGSFPAVEHDRIHVLTDDALLTPSHRVVGTVARLAKLLHPEADLD
ncbi:MAG: helical backbone metal receptor [Planctomycetota bacterium]